MEIIYQKTRQITSTITIKEIFCIYGNGVYCMQKFIKQGKAIQLRTGKILDSYKEYASLESKIFLVDDELLSDPVYVSATDTLDVADCEHRKFHMSFYPDAHLILAIKKFYVNKVAQNVL